MNNAYFIFHKLHRFPHEWINLPLAERAVIYAFVDKKIKDDQKEKSKAQRGRSAKRRR